MTIEQYESNIRYLQIIGEGDQCIWCDSLNKIDIRLETWTQDRKRMELSKTTLRVKNQSVADDKFIFSIENSIHAFNYTKLRRVLVRLW